MAKKLPLLLQPRLLPLLLLLKLLLQPLLLKPLLLLKLPPHQPLLLLLSLQSTKLNQLDKKADASRLFYLFRASPL